MISNQEKNKNNKEEINENWNTKSIEKNKWVNKIVQWKDCWNETSFSQAQNQCVIILFQNHKRWYHYRPTDTEV